MHNYTITSLIKNNKINNIAKQKIKNKNGDIETRRCS